MIFGMPIEMASKAALLGGLTGLFPIGWIVLNIIFLYQLTEQNGSFKVLQDSIAGITEDRRLQLLLIAFAFGAFFEGAAGFGTPVAVTAAILIGLGFFTFGSKDSYSTQAVPFLMANAIFISVGFDNIPPNTMTRLVAQARSAVTWVYKNAKKSAEIQISYMYRVTLQVVIWPI